MDADGLIKLHRAGVLAQVVGAFACTIPQTVYEEVITKGKERLHRDAEAIEEIISDTVTVLPVQGGQQPEPGLGAGELGVLGLIPQQPDAIVVSDDRRFLAVLSTRGVGFITPSDMLVVLARRGVVTAAGAKMALERLRPAIRRGAYWDARRDLELGGGHEEE